VIAHRKQTIGSVQSPKKVVFVEAIPRTSSGKPDKKVLRKDYWTGDRAVNRALPNDLARGHSDALAMT
jgi:acyl-coenzyme A synthetase/AMP-(fatty) acid ligase